MKKHDFILCLVLVTVAGILLAFFGFPIPKPGKNEEIAYLAEKALENTTATTQKNTPVPSPKNTPVPSPKNTPAAPQNNTPVPSPAITPRPVLEMTTEDGAVTYHDIHKLSDLIESDRHIRIMPGDYELTATLPDEFDFKNIKNLTIEGVGPTPVRIWIENLRPEMMSFTDCSNITLINLMLSPALEDNEYNQYEPREGNVLRFSGNNENITIKNCILSGYSTGMSATKINRLICEDTVITGQADEKTKHRGNPGPIMEIGRLRDAVFTRCTFVGDDAYIIRMDDSHRVKFNDCLFAGGYYDMNRNYKFTRIPSIDGGVFGIVNQVLRVKLINMEQENHGIMVRNSLIGDHDDFEEYKNLLDRFYTTFPDDLFTFEILQGGLFHLKIPLMLKDVDDELQQCLEKILLCLKDSPYIVDELFLEIGPIDVRYNNVQEMLERFLNGGKVSFWETSIIYFGPLDANIVNPDNKPCLSVQQARETLLSKVPLPLSTNDYEPFVDITNIGPGEPTLVYEEGRLFYLFDTFSYGITENIGYDGFCIDAVTGTLNKYFDHQYVEVTSADKTLMADIVNYLEQNGDAIPLNEWMKVQVYGQELVSVYIGGEQYYQLKMIKTPESVSFEHYKPGLRFEGDCSPGLLELPDFDCPKKNWNEEYDLQWTFSEGMMYHFTYQRVGDILLVHGHDGGISGHHDEEYLYGLNIKTGKKIWSVFGGYMGIAYYLANDQERIYVLTETYEHEDSVTNIKCIRIDTGKILWEKDVQEIYSFFLTDFAAMLQRNEDSSIILVLDGTSGKTQWKKRIEESDVYLVRNEDSPGLMVRKNEDIICFDWKTGEELWTVTSGQGVNATQEAGITKSQDGLTDNGEQPAEWFPFEGDEKLIDLQTGQVLDVRPLKPEKWESIETFEDDKEYKGYINDEYSMVRIYDRKMYDWKEIFSVYSNSSQEKLWSKEDYVLDWVLYGDELIYFTNTKITSVNLLTGIVNWCKPFSVNLDIAPLEDYHLIKPVIVNDLLILSEQGKIVVFDTQNGERLYEVQDYSIINLMAGVSHQYSHSLMVIDGMLFIGSANGKLSCLKMEP